MERRAGSGRPIRRGTTVPIFWWPPCAGRTWIVATGPIMRRPVIRMRPGSTRPTPLNPFDVSTTRSTRRSPPRRRHNVRATRPVWSSRVGRRASRLGEGPHGSHTKWASQRPRPRVLRPHVGHRARQRNERRDALYDRAVDGRRYILHRPVVDLHDVERPRQRIPVPLHVDQRAALRSSDLVIAGCDVDSRPLPRGDLV